MNPTNSSFKKDKSPYFTAPAPSPRPVPESVTTSIINMKELHYLGLQPTEQDAETQLNQQLFN